MRFCYAGVAAIALAVFSQPGARAQDEVVDELTSPPDGGPVEVRLRVMLLDLNAISGASQTFTANVAFVARWEDPRLAHDGDNPVAVALDEIWYPRLQILNQQRVQKTFADEAIVFPSGEVVYAQRFWGNFSQPLELHEFPFDRQDLAFQLVVPGLAAARLGSTRLIDNVRLALNPVSDWGMLAGG